MIFNIGFGISLLGKASDPNSSKIQPCKIVVTGLLFVLWYYVFPDIAGENVVISSHHKLYMILLWGMTNFISGVIAVTLFGSNTPENEPKIVFKRACRFSILEMAVMGFLIGAILLNNLELSQEVRYET